MNTRIFSTSKLLIYFELIFLKEKRKPFLKIFGKGFKYCSVSLVFDCVQTYTEMRHPTTREFSDSSLLRFPEEECVVGYNPVPGLRSLFRLYLTYCNRKTNDIRAG